jgi:hypothetical protein
VKVWFARGAVLVAVAFKVVEALQLSSARGMNVLAVMHQPRYVACCVD